MADIGSGTGMLSQHFVGRVKNVFAIEPNREMGQVAENALGSYPSFASIEGFSNATTLPEHSVDLIVVGRAIHWFHPQSTRTEFLRILKPDGWLAVLQVPCTDTKLVDAIKSIRTQEHGWNVRGDKSRLKPKPLSFYYGSNDYLVRHFPYSKQETWEEFLGRLSSISSAPGKDHPSYPDYKGAAKKIFDQFSVNGRLTVNVATALSLGQIKRP